MPGLQPTLIIGLGTTGLKILEYCQKFLLEEFKNDIPCIQLLAFETVENFTASKSIRAVPLTVPNTDTVRRKLNSPDKSEMGQVTGYREWLDTKILEMNDSFKAGAGGFRSAGRLILWENWEKVKQEISTAFDNCRASDNRTLTDDLLTTHYKDNGIKFAPGPLVGQNPIIFVVGTLCGGSCSGMFADLGFLLRSTYGKEVTRILTATLITREKATTPKNMQTAANCYGALRELDFYFHGFRDNSWSYTLPDGISKVDEKCDPYSLVYLVSSFNGSVELKTGLEQMAAMNLFLDVVGQGWTEKSKANEDLVGNVIAPKLEDQQGYVRSFFTFGLSAVWYPKAKITGMAACDLGVELCDSWIGIEDELRRAEIENQAREDFEQLTQYIEKDIGESVNVKLKELSSKSGLVRDTTRPLAELLQKDKQEEIQKALKEMDKRLPETAAEAGKRLKAKVSDRFDGFKNCAQLRLYWKYLKGFIAAAVSGASAGNEIGTVAPNTQPLIVLQRRANTAAKSIWVRMVFQRNAVARYYRETYFNRFIKEWETPVKAFVEGRKRIVFRILQYLQEDKTVLKSLYPDSVFQSVTEAIDKENDRLAAHITAARQELDDRRKHFEELGGSVVVHEVYLHGSVQNDVNENKAQIRANSGIPVVSVKWHLSDERRNPTRLETERAFWEQDAAALAENIVYNYQREGLRVLPNNLATEPDGQLQTLANNSKPYQKMNDRYIPVVGNHPNEFIFGGQSPKRLNEIATAVKWDECLNGGQCIPNDLSHILFLYHEDRCFAVDALDVFDAVQRQAEQHKPYTHKDASFFDPRRIQDVREAEILMESSIALFPENVFNMDGSKPRFVFRRDDDTSETFVPGSKETYKQIALVKGALDKLRETVLHALRQMTVDEFKAVFAQKADTLEVKRQQAEDQKGQEEERRLRSLIELLRAFRKEVAAKVFPQLEPGEPANGA